MFVVDIWRGHSEVENIQKGDNGGGGRWPKIFGVTLTIQQMSGHLKINFLPVPVRTVSANVIFDKIIWINTLLT